MDEASLLTLKNEIAELEQTLANKKRRFEELKTALADQATRTITTQEPLSKNETGNHSPPEAKIALFRSLFKGREDIYAQRFIKCRLPLKLILGFYKIVCK